MSARTRSLAAQVVLAGVCLGLAACLAQAQQRPGRVSTGTAAYASARGLAGRATEWTAAARFDEARGLLENALAYCPQGEQGRDCRRVLRYGIGFVLQSEALQRPATTRDSINQLALESFQEVLRENPRYEPARRGITLVFQRMGAQGQQSQDSIIRRLANEDVTGDYSLLLGDYYQRTGKPADARRYYERAARLEPADIEPQRRLLDLYRQPDLPAGDLEKLAADWRLRFPELAPEAYAVLMRRLYATDPARAAAQLPAWIGASAALDRIGPRFADDIPAAYTTEPFQALRQFLAAPDSAAISPWWQSDEDRREALATAALSLGRWQVSAAPRRAEQIWQRGQALVRGGMPGDPLSPAWLALSTELVVLYGNVHELDPDGSRVAALESRLFGMKGMAIASGDVVGMLRFHSALGMSYARRGIWGAVYQTHSALYQLSHALCARQRLDDSLGIEQPLPEIARQLAIGLHATRSAGASQAFQDAAAAYLDADDPATTAALLDSASALAAGVQPDIRSCPAPQRPRPVVASLPDLRRWLEPRRAAAAAATAHGANACRLEVLTAAEGTPAASHFDARQRFRVLADCARAAGPSGSGLAAEALRGLLDSHAPVVGIGDLVRLEDVQQKVFAGFGQRVRPPERLTLAVPGANVVPAALPGEGNGVYVRLDADAALAADIVRGLGRSEYPPQLRVRRGVVTVLDGGDTAVSDIAQRLRGIKGVVQVEVGAGQR